MIKQLIYGKRKFGKRVSASLPDKSKKIINILLVKKALFVRDVGCQQILKVLGVNTGIIVHIVW